MISVQLMIVFGAVAMFIISVSFCIFAVEKSITQGRLSILFALSCLIMFISPIICLTSFGLYIITGMNVEYVESEELSRESIELVSVDSYHTGSEDKNNYLYSDDTSYIYYYRSEDDRIHHGLLPMESTHIITECTQAPYLDIIQEKEIRHCRWLIFGDVRFRHNTRYEAHIPEGSIAG